MLHSPFKQLVDGIFSATALQYVGSATIEDNKEQNTTANASLTITNINIAVYVTSRVSMYAYPVYEQQSAGAIIR